MCWADSLNPTGIPPRGFPHLRREVTERGGLLPVREPRRRNRGFSFGESANLGDPAVHLVARQMPAGAGLRSLPALEVEGLGFAAPFPC